MLGVNLSLVGARRRGLAPPPQSLSPAGAVRNASGDFVRNTTGGYILGSSN